MRRIAQTTRTDANNGELRLADVVRLVRMIRQARDELAALATTPGLQAYARAATGNAAFDLAAEAAALDAAYRQIIAEARAIYNALFAIAEDGTVTYPPSRIAQAQAQNLATACAALESTIQPSEVVPSDVRA